MVGGITPFTTIDFPGRLAAVVFLQGCPWRCGYCHNPQLLPRHAPTTQPWHTVRTWLDSRRGLLDGVVFSGSEPLLHRGLADALRDVRSMGFATALHTGGAYPERLARLLPLLDWVGFDVKAPFGDYRTITGADDGSAARQALAHLLDSGVAHEIRCTLAPVINNASVIERLAQQLATLGASALVLQPCRDAALRQMSVDDEILAAARRHLRAVVPRQ